MEKKTVIITGTSSGYGKAIAKEFSKQRWNVIATMAIAATDSSFSRVKSTISGSIELARLVWSEITLSVSTKMFFVDT